jgi:hypothetical protein
MMLRAVVVFCLLAAVGLAAGVLVRQQLQGRYPTWPAIPVGFAPLVTFVILAGWLRQTLAILAAMATALTMLSILGRHLRTQRRLQSRPTSIPIDPVHRIADDLSVPLAQLVQAAEDRAARHQ